MLTASAVDKLLDALEANWLGWSESMAPVIMGQDNAELGDELTRSFCRVDPVVAAQFAEVTFLSDNRSDLPDVAVPTLVLQCSQDALADVSVGEYVATQLPHGSLQVLRATGHCPHMSSPRRDRRGTARVPERLTPSWTTPRRRETRTTRHRSAT
jgi:sigma-B regulation protein RsbQ